MVRPNCCEKLNVKRGLWTEEEDGMGCWTALPKTSGLRRCGKSCRIRGANNSRPDLRHENFTPQEEELIVRLHAAIGSRWSIIAQQLPGRTDNDVKNCWNTKLKKKLSEMGIDPVTHKPFSQILADYGTIGGLPNARTRIESLNRDSKHAFIFKPEHFLFPSQQGFSNFNTHCESNNSLDLLSQLQTISLVTETKSNITNKETNTPHIDFSSSSSPSYSSAASQVNSSIVFSWRDFLLEDPFVPSDVQQKEDVVFSTNDESGQEEIEMLQNAAEQEGEHIFCVDEEMSYNFPNNNSCEASSSADSSFVEAMLDQQNNMLLDFPCLLEESFSY